MLLRDPIIWEQFSLIASTMCSVSQETIWSVLNDFFYFWQLKGFTVADFFLPEKKKPKYFISYTEPFLSNYQKQCSKLKNSSDLSS